MTLRQIFPRGNESSFEVTNLVLEVTDLEVTNIASELVKNTSFEVTNSALSYRMSPLR